MPSFCKVMLLAVGLFVLTAFSFGSEIHASGPAVIVNGVEVLRMSTPANGATPEQRAKTTAARISTQAYWGQVDAVQDGDDWLVRVSNEPVLRVTATEAAAHGVNAESLAEGWASQLKVALDLPPLKLSDNFARVPNGGSETVKIAGTLAAKAVIAVQDKTVATVSRVPGGFEIRGKSIGHTAVTVTAGASMESVDVDVKPYAANFPQTLVASVTGAPASDNTVSGVVDGALKTLVQAQPNAHWTFNLGHYEPLQTDRVGQYAVHVWASAPDTFPSAGTVNVVVRNVGLAPQVDDDLWYSNNPETVKEPGSLFSASLKKGQSARLLYHHLNGTQQDMFLRVEAVNLDDKPAKIELIPGDSTPNMDPVRAGLAAADQFVENWISGSGEVITIPPGSVLPISLRRLSPGETASGLCSIRLVDGADSLLVRTDAFPPLPLDERWLNTLYTSTPWHEVGTHQINDYDRAPCEANDHIYPNPYTKDNVDYEVGGRQGFYRIGQKPIQQLNSDGALDGNFGVIYSIRASLKNPTANATDVEIVFEASAGYSGGLFVINGSVMKTHLLPPKGTQRIGVYHLPAGASEVLDITTLPLSGSSYPATLMIRPVDTETASATARTH